MEKQDNDTMLSWNGISLFDTEEGSLKTKCTPTSTEDMDLTISKIKRLQKNVKRQVDVNVKNKIPEVTTVNQEAKPITKTVKPVENVEEGNAKNIKEVKEEIPTENQHVEEKV